MKPIIGVSPDTHSGRRIRTRTPQEKIVYIWDFYLRAVEDHGAVPVILPVTTRRDSIRTLMEGLDGILLAGGNFDIPPEYFGEKPKPWLGPVKKARSDSELAILREALKRDMPVLGICGGMQLINVAFGGSLYQDIPEERPGSANHSQKVRKDRTSHQVRVSPGTRLHSIMKGRKGRGIFRSRVNSTHHQAVKDAGRGLVVSAVSPDGIIEGVESPAHAFMLGVQWHPELLYARQKEHGRIFSSFTRAAGRYGK